MIGVTNIVLNVTARVELKVFKSVSRVDKVPTW
jgi:hypothetical protein